MAFWNALELDTGMAAQFCEYTKNYWTAHFSGGVTYWMFFSLNWSTVDNVTPVSDIQHSNLTTLSIMLWSSQVQLPLPWWYILW